MVKFSYGGDSVKKRAISIVFADWLVFILIALAALVLSIYFLCVGFLSDREALVMGFPLLFIFLFFAIAFCLAYIKCKKQIESFCAKNSSNGILDYELTKQGDAICIFCTQTGTTVGFSTVDVKYARTIGSFIIVKLNDKRIICFPNTKEISLLLK